jgi:hypothetical protein
MGDIQSDIQKISEQLNQVTQYLGRLVGLEEQRNEMLSSGQLSVVVKEITKDVEAKLRSDKLSIANTRSNAATKRH